MTASVVPFDMAAVAPTFVRSRRVARKDHATGNQRSAVVLGGPPILTQNVGPTLKIIGPVMWKGVFLAQKPETF